MNELALFAGGGGGILGGKLLGWRTVCAVEIDPYCRELLLARQRDRVLARFPIWDDVRTFDGKPWRGLVDVISGGFPCQDISAAGKRAGIDGPRSGLWREFARIIGEVRPRFAFVENSPRLRSNGLHAVLGDLASMGYDARWGVLGARHLGAPHIRDRIWILAYTYDDRQRTSAVDGKVANPRATTTDAADAASQRRTQPQHNGQTIAAPNGADNQSVPADANSAAVWEQPGRGRRPNRTKAQEPRRPHWWSLDHIQGVDDGVAHRMDRVRATGNGQVPSVAALAFKILSEGL